MQHRQATLGDSWQPTLNQEEPDLIVSSFCMVCDF
jgi:hypothetical protein